MTVAIAMVFAASAAWLAIRPSRRSRRLGLVPHRLLGWCAGRVMSRQHRAQARASVREALAEVVADVRAGQPPARALGRALAERAPCPAPRASASARWGGDVVESLQADSRASGQPLLAAAAACWSVAAEHGAGLADSLDRIVQQDRRAEEVRRQLEAHLAAPRATARMLALLPVLGLGLGIAIGGDPLGWLLGTALGWGCLFVGLGLTLLGLAWAGRIVARTERLL